MFFCSCLAGMPCKIIPYILVFNPTSQTSQPPVLGRNYEIIWSAYNLTIKFEVKNLVEFHNCAWSTLQLDQQTAALSSITDRQQTTVPCTTWAAGQCSAIWFIWSAGRSLTRPECIAWPDCCLWLGLGCRPCDWVKAGISKTISVVTVVMLYGQKH